MTSEDAVNLEIPKKVCCLKIAVLGTPHPPFPSPRTTIALWIFYRTFIVGKINRLLTDVGSYINILCIQKGFKNSCHSFFDLVAGL